MNIMEYPQWSHKFPTCENVIFVYNLHYFEIYFDKSLGQLNHCLVAEYMHKRNSLSVLVN